jgi:hypothetical protein
MRILPSRGTGRARGRLSAAALAAGLAAALAVPAGAAFAATPAATGHHFTVQALKVAPKTVKPGLGQAAVAVTWTLVDTARVATTVSGHLFIRMQGATPGTYLGMAYDVPFAYQSTPQDGATWVSGGPGKSSYSYVFEVPVFANAKKAAWTVTEIDAHDDAGTTLTATDPDLAAFSRTVATIAQVDSNAPDQPSVFLSGGNGSAPEYVYDGSGPATVRYQISSHDSKSGFWKGSLLLDGPNGQSLTTDFEYFDSTTGGGPCSGSSAGLATYAFCAVSVSFPAGSVGTWTVNSVSVTDNAGNSATYPALEPLPVVLTDNGTLSADGFTVSPNPLNTWGQDKTTSLTFSAHGVQQGLASVTVNAGYGCNQQGQVPTSNPDGTYSLPVAMHYYAGDSCVVTGLTLIDGAGDVALYGSDFGAPDPGVTIRRLPDTVPPTVTAAHVSPASIPQSVLGSVVPHILATVSAPIAPVQSFSTTVYDANGNPTGGGSSGGVGPVFDGGTAELPIFLPASMAPGTYTVSFTLDDAGGLSTSYGGPGGLPVPGGPVTFTVTAS